MNGRIGQFKVMNSDAKDMETIRQWKIKYAKTVQIGSGWQEFRVGEFYIRGDKHVTYIHGQGGPILGDTREVRIPVQCFRAATPKILTGLWHSSDWSILKRMQSMM